MILGMGGLSGKENVAGHKFKPEEVERIKNTFQISGNTVSLGPVRKHWESFMSPQLADQFLCSLHWGTGGDPTLDQFLSFYDSFVRDSDETKALALMKIVTKNYREEVTSMDYALLQEFVRNMLQSYKNILVKKESLALRSWITIGLGDENLAQLANYLSKDMDTYSNKIDVGSLEVWFHMGGITMEVFNTVMNYAYNMENPRQNESIVPRATAPSQFSTVLSLADVLFLNMSIPKECCKHWRLLFSTSTHGESWTKFVSLSQRQGPSILVFKDGNGAVFGGFASDSWKCQPQFYGNHFSFLYTLLPDLDRFDSTNYNGNFQYMNYGQQTLPNGVGMGGKFNYWGLFMPSDFGEGNCAESCSTFRGYKPLCGKTTFKVAELEVWGVGRADPTPQELGERVVGFGSSALGSDTAAEALLEMAGREFYSKQMRVEDPSDILD